MNRARKKQKMDKFESLKITDELPMSNEELEVDLVRDAFEDVRASRALARHNNGHIDADMGEQRQEGADLQRSDARIRDLVRENEEFPRRIQHLETELQLIKDLLRHHNLMPVEADRVESQAPFTLEVASPVGCVGGTIMAVGEQCPTDATG